MANDLTKCACLIKPQKKKNDKKIGHRELLSCWMHGDLRIVCSKPLQYCKVTSLQLIKINEKKNKTKKNNGSSKPLPPTLLSVSLPSGSSWVISFHNKSVIYWVKCFCEFCESLRTPWTEEPSRLQSMGSQRVGHDWATSHTLEAQDSLVGLSP